MAMMSSTTSSKAIYIGVNSEKIIKFLIVDLVNRSV